MSKPTLFENKAFQAAASEIGFNLVPQINTFNSVFDIKPLDSTEAIEIENLLSDNVLPETLEKEQIEHDIGKLKQITAEIKAIGRQGTILMGERVAMAREILKSYKVGAFTKWLETTFGSRKSGYNALAYFDLFNSLPDDDLRERFKKIPLRAAYILASRSGDLEVKRAIIRDSYDLRHNELVDLIQGKLPLESEVDITYKVTNKKLIDQANEVLKQLHDRKKQLSEKDKLDLIALKNLLSSILS